MGVGGIASTRNSACGTIQKHHSVPFTSLRNQCSALQQRHAQCSHCRAPLHLAGSALRLLPLKNRLQARRVQRRGGRHPADPLLPLSAAWRRCFCCPRLLCMPRK
jgi:hypothetical protein